MKKYNFVMRIEGSAKGIVYAEDKKKALEALEGGQWDDIDIDVEDVIDIEKCEAEG